MIDINNDRLENIKMFKNFEIYDTFSKYSDNLKKIFGDRSFEKFYENLITNRRFQDDIFLKMFDKSHGYKLKEQFNINQYKKFLRELKREAEQEEINRKNYRNKFKLHQRDENSFKSLDSEKKSNSKEKKIERIADIGRYNPNYNSIRKNLPRILFSRKEYIPNVKLKDKLLKKFSSYSPVDRNNKESSKEKNKDNITENNKEIIKETITENNPDTIKEKIKDNNKGFKKKKLLEIFGKNKSQVLLTQETKIANSFLNLDKTNHALRFSKYTSRKPLVIDSNLYSNFSASNILNPKSKNNIKGLIEFNKMSSNLNINSYIPKQSKIPPLGSYDPKYNYTQSKSPDCIIDRKPIITKQMKLKKILYDYNVPKQYELITDLNL
jgi:hypothetical protein